MTTQGLRLVQLCAALLVLLALRGEAAAYCRTRTCEFRSAVDCPIDDLTGCFETGAFVYWKSGCVPYAVQRDGSADEDISASQVAELLDQGFRVWSELDCGRGGSPELASSRQGLISCDAVEYDCTAGARNSNLVVFRDDFVNSDYGLRFGVIALTTVTANLISGEIFDADIELNSRDEDFSLDAVAPGGPRDLRGVINHELGHLLGLSHSRERGALMRALYEGTAAPAADDAAGMCAALGAANGDPACAAEVFDPDSACLGSNTACTSIETEAGEDPGGSCACRTVRSEPRGPGALVWVIPIALWAARRRGPSRQRVL